MVICKDQRQSDEISILASININLNNMTSNYNFYSLHRMDEISNHTQTAVKWIASYSIVLCLNAYETVIDT